jgi:hypothetical protein
VDGVESEASVLVERSLEEIQSFRAINPQIQTAHNGRQHINLPGVVKEWFPEPANGAVGMPIGSVGDSSR